MFDKLPLLRARVGLWAARDDLPLGLRAIVGIVDELAADLVRFDFPPPDVVDATRILSCHVCRRVGEAVCTGHCRQDPCPLGWRRA